MYRSHTDCVLGEQRAKWTWPPVPTELITVLQKHWLSSAGTGVWSTDPWTYNILKYWWHMVPQAGTHNIVRLLTAILLSHKGCIADQMYKRIMWESTGFCYPQLSLAPFHSSYSFEFVLFIFKIHIHLFVSLNRTRCRHSTSGSGFRVWNQLREIHSRTQALDTTANHHLSFQRQKNIYTQDNREHVFEALKWIIILQHERYQ